ncbi:LPXTG cell wall anchor domain-containing protein [Staphylococcus hominis]
MILLFLINDIEKSLLIILVILIITIALLFFIKRKDNK